MDLATRIPFFNVLSNTEREKAEHEFRNYGENFKLWLRNTSSRHALCVYPIAVSVQGDQ